MEEVKYPNLGKLLGEREMSIPAYAEFLGVTPSTARTKLQGKYDFTLGEAKRTMELFPGYKIEFIFKRSN